MSAPPGLEKSNIIRYSTREIKHLHAFCRDGPCPAEMECYAHLRSKRESEGPAVKPKGKKADRPDWRADGGGSNGVKSDVRSDGRHERSDSRKERTAQTSTPGVKLETLRKLELPFGKREEKQSGSRPSRSSGNQSGGWDEVEAGGGWVGASSSARVSSGGHMTAADKMRQFEKERLEILSQRTGGTPSSNRGQHLDQHAAGEEGSYHIQSDSLMAELQAESGQLVSHPPPVRASPMAAISSSSATMDISFSNPSSIWSPAGGATTAGVDFFSTDFFSASTPIIDTPVIAGLDDSGAKRSTRLKSWLSTLSGDDNDKNTAEVSTEERASKSRMNFVPHSPEALRPTPGPNVPVVELQSSSPQKSTKISLNSLFSMAAKSNEEPRVAGETVTQAADVMAKLGFSGSPSREELARDHDQVHSAPPIASSLGPLSPGMQTPTSPFSFPIHHFPPPGVSPDPMASSGLSAGGLATPTGAKTISYGQQRSGSKGVNVSASSRLLIQQQKNKRQQLQKQVVSVGVAGSEGGPIAEMPIKFGDVNADEIMNKKSQSNATLNEKTASAISKSATTNHKTSNETVVGQHISGADGKINEKRPQVTQINSSPAPVSGIAGMKKINLNSLFTAVPKQSAI